MTQPDADAGPQPLADPPLADPPIRFRIIHIVYVIAVLSCALATFGTGGIFLGAFVACFWAAIFVSNSRPRALRNACLIVLFIACPLTCLLLPAVRLSREAARRMQCSNNLKQIALALHNYHDQYGSFPPAYLADDQGKPLHSWRVLLLPFLEEQQLYSAYHFDEPWDGPRNSKLLDSVPACYRCPTPSASTALAKSATSYFAIVDSATIWPGATSTSMKDCIDGTSNTVLVLEDHQANVSWLEPRDLQLEEALAGLVDGGPTAGSHAQQGETFFYRAVRGRYVSMADGSVRFVRYGVPRPIWSAMLLRNDGLAWSDHDLQVLREIGRELKVGNCIRLAVFLGLCLWPLPWVWLNPTSR